MYLKFLIKKNSILILSKLTDALSPSIQPVPHVALAAISDARHGDAPAIQAEVAVGLAHVGNILGLDNNRA